ncbi:MAG: hypothetical protein OXG58_06875 [Gemmatimonadetes bacterium]|nr:hypothetical protein [Gemmatimonadota bacterium]MCY3943242.1 hypothetical protein [Gemmatimonadota bacterium]
MPPFLADQVSDEHPHLFGGDRVAEYHRVLPRLWPAVRAVVDVPPVATDSHPFVNAL